MTDPDADIRIAAFSSLRAAMQIHGGAVPWSVLASGFEARGRTWRYATAAEGIFRPAGMAGLLSVKTVIPSPKGRIWYHDQASPDLQSDGELLSYAFTGSDPGNTRNRWLHEAKLQQFPIIYFFGVAPGVYEPLFPAFVVEWDANALRCGLAFSAGAADSLPVTSPARRYALRTVQLRLHQAAFREMVLAAYGRRCALSGLPETRLIDAAHIMPDADIALGQPDVRNGICMSKIHHAAYDADLIGIDADLGIHVSERLLRIHDGPFLEHGIKALAGRRLSVPADTRDAPDRDRLALRFLLYQANV